jgi:membrane protease YdiL (CAAX protease family)
VCQRCDRVQTIRHEYLAAEAVEGRPLRAALTLYFILLGVSVLMLISGLVVGDSRPKQALWVEWSAELIDAVVVFAAVALMWRRAGPGLKRVGRWFWYPAALGGACITFGIADLVVRAITSHLGGGAIEMARPILGCGYGWWVVVLAVAVQPAIVEELAFRGVILPALGQVMPTAAAVVVCSFMFMVLHLAPASFPHLLIIGLALGGLRVASGSIYPGVLLHFTHNLLCTLSERHHFF